MDRCISLVGLTTRPYTSVTFDLDGGINYDVDG